MAIRINQAKNFKGKAYVAADELDNLIKSLTLEVNDTVTSSVNSAATWLVEFTPADSATDPATSVDLTAIKDYIDNKSITVTAGNGISIDATGSNALNHIISTNLKITKVATATGYAATYKLQYLSGTDTYSDVTGDPINIMQDQFIKAAAFGWSTGDNDTTATNWQASKDATHIYPTIKIEVWTTDNAGTTPTTTLIGVPLADTFEEYQAGNGIEIGTSNAIAVKLETATDALTLVTTSGVAVDLIDATASGVKVADVQAAINVAVNNEHAKAGSAIAELDGKVDALQGATSAAVSALNTDIGTVATAVHTLDGKVDTAFADADSKVQSAITAVITNTNSALDSTVATINGNVTTAVSTLNSRIETVATNAQSAANALEDEIVALDSKVQGAFGALDTAIETAIDAVESSVTTHTANAVQMLEVTSTINATSGVVNVTQTANNIVAVYDASGVQIYPEISRASSSANGTWTYTLTADYGTTGPVDASWTILYTVALSAYAPVNAGDTTYDVTDSSAKTVASGTPGSYSNATKTAAGAVTVTGTTYADAATVTPAGATAPDADSAVTIPALDYIPTPPTANP